VGRERTQKPGQKPCILSLCSGHKRAQSCWEKESIRSEHFDAQEPDEEASLLVAKRKKNDQRRKETGNKRKRLKETEQTQDKPTKEMKRNGLWRAEKSRADPAKVAISNQLV